MHTIKAPPEAALLVESMRDMGYTLKTALADIIDNSITAGAGSIRILAPPPGAGASRRIGIVDDGRGMSEDELHKAMRLGSRSPRDERSSADLGRFGLGLKTASSSQGTKLTVLTRQAGQTSAACWNLERIVSTNQWDLQIPEATGDIPFHEELGESGTLVLWEDLDRIEEEAFSACLDDAVDHLELVFHRFISGGEGRAAISISVNGRPLEANDPFCTFHDATQHGPVERFKSGRGEVTAKTYTLPHRQKTSAQEWDRIGRAEGHVRNQGFYVYRERRLIIQGTWFGLARQRELTKLARVRIDLPNSLDSEWSINIMKATARPPHQVRKRLRQIIDKIGEGSTRAYTRRGHRLMGDDRLPVWVRTEAKGAVSYDVNRSHPVVRDFEASLPADLRPPFSRVVSLIVSGLPLTALFADWGESPDQTVLKSFSQEDLEHHVRLTYSLLRSLGHPDDVATAMLLSGEPCRSCEAASRRILDQVKAEEDSDA